MTNDNDNNTDETTAATLPAAARLPINRCNLPAVILGSLTFQRHPAPLSIDGIDVLHHDLFQRLDALDDAASRAQCFNDYMTVRFRLHTLEDAGLTEAMRRNRGNANYLRLVRGWLFDPDSREGAVLKGWVESRFGLLPRYHKGSIAEAESEAYRRYLQERQAGLYNTNALEAQLDLLYSYCQYELARRYPDRSHWHLYRGCNRIEECGSRAQCAQAANHQYIILNNISSFSTSKGHADTFGDVVIETEVPLSKIFFFSRLLPGILTGEDEIIVIGGVYEIQVARH